MTDRSFKNISDAVKDGNIEEVRYLLETKDVDVNAKDKNGVTPLHEAADRGLADIAELLIAGGANVNAEDYDGNTPLHLAIGGGHAEIARLLVIQGANVNAKDNYGMSPRQIANDCWSPQQTETCFSYPLHSAAENGNIEEIILLLSQGVNVNSVMGAGKKYTPLHVAVESGNIEIVKLLVSHGANVNAKGKGNRRTPLHRAVYYNTNVDIVKFLISQGADVNAQDAYGFTPLHWAELKGKVEFVDFLVSQGAGNTTKGTYGRTPLHRAARIGNTEFVKSLVSLGADVNVKDDNGWTPLHCAAKAKNMSVVEFLVSQGADVNAKNKKGYTPFQETVTRESIEPKQKTASLWANVEEKYPIHAKIKGAVVNTMSYGAFVELEKGIEGFLPFSEISKMERISVLPKILAVGDEIEVVILSINKGNQVMSLGIPSSDIEDSWEHIDERYPVGAKIVGTVYNLTRYGAFIEIEEGIHGLLHVNEMSWLRKIKHPDEMVQKGQQIMCQVLSVDKEKHRITLGLKQLSEDPWKQRIPNTYKPNRLFNGIVTQITDYGAFIRLEEGVEGLLHISEITNNNVKNLEEIIKVGDEIKVKILRIDSEKRRIGLSCKCTE